jgi:hypothetical protein
MPVFADLREKRKPIGRQKFEPQRRHALVD